MKHDRRCAEATDARSSRQLENLRVRNAKYAERIHNPNLRLTGRDLSALKLQMAEKELRKAEEKQADIQYKRYIEDMNNFAHEMELQKAAAKEQNKKDQRASWEQHIQILQEAKAQRAAQDAAQVATAGVSSMLYFHGEDPAAQKRKAMQAAQIQKWSRAGAAEKAARAREEKLEDMEYASHIRNICEASENAQKEVEAEIKLRNQQVYNYNLQASEKKKALAKRVVREQKLKEQMEVRHREEFFDKVEDKKLANYSHLDTNRFRPDHFRGMEREELVKIQQEQQLQIESKKERESQEAARGALYARMTHQHASAASAVVHEEQKKRAAMAREVFEENQRLVEAKKVRQMEEKAHIDAPAFEANFFSSFGTSHR